MTIQEVKDHFNQEGTQVIKNDAAGYQFIKRADGVLLQFSNGSFKFYKTVDGLAKAALHKIKRG